MRFEFDIEPVEQARPRTTRFGKGIRLYDPKKVTVYKQQLGHLVRQAMHPSKQSAPFVRSTTMLRG